MEAKTSADLLRGHTDTVVLSVLLKGDSYGYKIHKSIIDKLGGWEISAAFKIKLALLLPVACILTFLLATETVLKQAELIAEELAGR